MLGKIPAEDTGVGKKRRLNPGAISALDSPVEMIVALLALISRHLFDLSGSN